MLNRKPNGIECMLEDYFVETTDEVFYGIMRFLQELPLSFESRVADILQNYYLRKAKEVYTSAY